MSKSRVQEAMCRSGIYQCSDGYRLEIVWSTYQRRNKGYTKRELGSERADMLRRIGLMVAQMSLMQPLVCAKSWRPCSSFLRGSQRAEFLVPPE